MFDKICGSNVISHAVLISHNRGNQLKGPSWSCDKEKPLGGKCLGQQHVTTGDGDEGTQLPGTPPSGQAGNNHCFPLLLFKKRYIDFMLNLTLFNICPVFQKHGSKERLATQNL